MYYGYVLVEADFSSHEKALEHASALTRGESRESRASDLSHDMVSQADFNASFHAGAEWIVVQEGI